MHPNNLTKVTEGDRRDAKEAIEAWNRARQLGAKGVKLGWQTVGNANREAAAARDAALAPILRELGSLSSHMAAAELSRRGFNEISYRTVHRARQRLGLDGAPETTRAARTKAGLAAAKARGLKMGSPKVIAGAFAARVKPTIDALRGEGLSFEAIAARMTELGVETARGGWWTGQTVVRVCNRLKAMADHADEAEPQKVKEQVAAE
jgi:hypothetical protein